MIRTKGYLLFGVVIDGALGATIGMASTMRAPAELNGLLGVTIGMTSQSAFGYPIGNINLSIPVLEHSPFHAVLEGYDTPTTKDFNASIPSLTFDCEVQISEVGTINLTIPSIRRSITGVDSCVGTISVSMPELYGTVSGITGVVGTINASIQSHSVDISGESGVIGTINITLPSIITLLSTLNGYTGTISLSLPRTLINVTQVIGATGTIALTLPSSRSVINGMFNELGTITMSIPMMRLGDFVTTYVDASGESIDNLNMVVNLHNKALTKYTNFNFNSMCYFKGINIGMTKNGIFEMTGTKDDGVVIDWNFRLPYVNLEIDSKKKLKHMWTSHKSTGDIIATIITPYGDEYEYDCESFRDTEWGTRVKFGKGIRTRYAMLDLRSVNGCDIELDIIRLFYDVLSKKR